MSGVTVTGEPIVGAGGRKGTHGHSTSPNYMHATFVAPGAGIKPGVTLKTISNLDVAPTIGRLLSGGTAKGGGAGDWGGVGCSQRKMNQPLRNDFASAAYSNLNETPAATAQEDVAFAKATQQWPLS